MLGKLERREVGCRLELGDAADGEEAYNWAGMEVTVVGW
jgi:hypothetical protein